MAKEYKMSIQQILKKVTAQDFPNELWATMPEGVNPTNTQSAWLEMAQRITEYDGDAYQLTDYIGEMSDSLIPVYTREKWREFMDYELWNSPSVKFEANEIVELSGNVIEIQTSFLNSMLYSIYAIAGYALINWAQKQIKEGN